MRASSAVRAVVAAAAAALVVAALIVPGVTAADRPAGILFDGVVNVTVREASADGGQPGAPIANAEVTLLVTLNDFPEGELQSLSATTADDGIATFGAVARPDGDTPVVHLEAHAHQETLSRDNGCVVGTSWDGAATGIATDGPDELVIEASPSSSIACPPQATIRGHVRDAAGHAIRTKTATVSIDTPPVGNAKTRPLTVDSHGAYKVTLPTWDGDDGPAVVKIAVTTAVTRHATLPNGCRRDYAQVGSRSVRVQLEVQGERPDVDVVTHEAVVGEACATTATPRPQSNGGGTGNANGGGASGRTHPTTTLPPTDGVTDALVARNDGATGTMTVAILGIAGIAGLAVGTMPRRRRD
ncbi:MAG: hypothetical protein ACJ77B_01175 [Chloroflexota bacterium]